MLGVQAEVDQRLIDLAVERGEGVGRGRPRPERIRPSAPLESPDPATAKAARGDDARERDRDVLGDRPFDLADKAQRHVQLRVVLPPRAGHAAPSCPRRWREPRRVGVARRKGGAWRLLLRTVAGTSRQRVRLKTPALHADIQRHPAMPLTVGAKEFTMANWSDPRPSAAPFGAALRAPARRPRTTPGCGPTCCRSTTTWPPACC